jgi:uncharacterized membrane protein
MGTASESSAPVEKQTGRLEAFSDGVFGIALTLLVLELKVPEIAITPGGPNPGVGRALWVQLAQQWPAYLSFVTSFFSVLVMWIHHHRVFRLVHGVDATLLFANGFLMFMVVLVPFPTAVISEYLDTPAGKAACAFYGATFTLVSTAFYLTLMAGFRKSVVSPHASPAVMKQLCRSYKAGAPLYLLATLAAPFSRWVSMGICTGLWFLWLITATDRLPGGGRAGAE